MLNKKLKNNVPFKELTLKSEFMFTEALKDKNICKDVIEITTGLKIKALSFHHEEQVYKNFKGLRGIQLDILAIDDEQTFYDLEMQDEDKGDTIKRSRYYHALIETKNVASGISNYNVVPKVYVIFICTFDPFDKALCKYTFRPYCEESKDLVLEDGAYTIFINTKGKNISNMPIELQEFIDYIEQPDKRKYSDKRIKELSNRVKMVHNDQEAEVRYVRLMEKLNECKEEGLKEGTELANLKFIINMYKNGVSIDNISMYSDCDILYIKRVCRLYDENSDSTLEELLNLIRKDEK
ncbi:MAG: Rpn family recombination-promoting nuclease/putative transposase [Lachnospiraceae bacterium]|nr:Rpn family recombination-promoting nuclease/putative transposase [Lachnospiraceae bacterium]